MNTSTIEAAACMLALCLLGLAVLALTAWIERPRRRPAKGRSINLRNR